MHNNALAQKNANTVSASSNELFPPSFYLPYGAAVETAFQMLCHARSLLFHDLGEETIRQMTFRLKSPESITEKLRKKHLPVSWEAANAALHDVAGLRVVLTSIEAVYRYAALLASSPMAEYVLSRDYIAHPKTSGYQSLHLLMMVPTTCQGQHLLVPVEIQLRTSSMDEWAVIDHGACYKPVVPSVSPA